MSLVTIDESKCKRDSVCVQECPTGIIEIKEKDAFPSLVEKSRELCIDCGHCVAVCPHGALSLEKMSPDDCVAVDRDLLPSSGQVEHLLRSRRSIRSYKKKPVPQEILAGIIDYARHAPNGHNDQGLKWIVISDVEELHRLAGMVVEWMGSLREMMPDIEGSDVIDLLINSWEKGQDSVFRGAPHLIIGCAKDTTFTPVEDCTIALSYMELAAYSKGLGTCWAGAFQVAVAGHPPILESLNLPEGHKFCEALMVGYPKYKYYRVPIRNEAKIIWR
jgi:nitroreductase/NAD-dependent dihydropyrimidine dehydrogenase PreA subunit